MANGQRFSQQSNSAASNQHKLGTRLRVHYRGRSTVVVIRDRTGGAFLDLSKRSFSELESLEKGRIQVCKY
jgi:rare lipoprotein A